MKKVFNLIVIVCLIFTLLPTMNMKVSAFTGSDVVAEAMVHVNQGDQYVWGTSGPDTFDCSGFVYYVFRQFGITLSKGASSYSYNGTSHSYGTIITNTSQLQSGDILCFGSSSSSIGHVGIYDANGGYIIHALNSDKDLLRSPTLSTWINSPGWNSNGNNQFRHAIRVNLSGSVGKTIVNPVSVSGKNVTVSWGAVSNASYYSVYLIQDPWGWNDVKYSTTSYSTAHTFNNVAPGSYCAFVIARPNADTVQSNWVGFSVVNTPSNPWISANNSNNITVTPNSNVTLRYGADNATNYWLGIDRDGVRIETLDRTGTSEYTRSYEIGNYSAYISAGNSGGYIDSTRVNFTVTEKDYIPTKTISYNNKVYALYDYKTSWNVANDIANKIGGHLATVGSVEEQNKIVELMSFGNKDLYWLGGTDSATEGVWSWIDGTPWNYTNWASGEPNNAVYLDQKENYLQVYKNGVWNDLPKIAYETSSVGFIVEIENYLNPIATNVYNKNTYMLFDYDMTWTEANEYCKLLGGHLATISDANEQTAIETLVSKSAWNLYYLGATDKTTEGTWNWVDGTPWDYTNWNTGQPDDYQGAEDYLQIYNSNKKWNDLNNYFSENTGFVCEIPFNETPTAQITNGKSSYLLFDQYLSWEDAKIYCENLGGHLVTITSQEEQNAVYNLAMQGGKNQYWLGASYGATGATNSWNWVTGESFSSYLNWDVLQPDYIGSENYLQMYRIANPYNVSSQAGKWNNTYVDNFRSGEAFFGTDKIGFICEIERLTVSFDSNGGSGIDSQIITKNENATKPINPTKADYIFESWYLDSDFVNIFDFNTPITTDITLFAKWINANFKIEDFSAINFNDNCIITAKIQNNNQIKSNVPVYIALYSDEGKLLQLRKKNINAVANEIMNISENISGVSECILVKIFIWKSDYGMEPIVISKRCSVLFGTIAPSVVGLVETEAKNILTSNNLKYNIKWDYDYSVSYGYVREQNPSAGTIVPIDSIAQLSFSLGAKPFEISDLVWFTGGAVYETPTGEDGYYVLAREMYITDLNLSYSRIGLGNKDSSVTYMWADRAKIFQRTNN